MQFYNVFNEDLGIYIKYKLLSPSNAEYLKHSLADLSSVEFKQEVISKLVFNAYTDVVPALRGLDPDFSVKVLNNIYLGAVLLNPALDINIWTSASRLDFFGDDEDDDDMSFDLEDMIEDDEVAPGVVKKIPKHKILSVQDALESKVIGQQHAVEIIAKTLKRHEAGLSNIRGPIGTFLCVGPSGVGKTLIAKELHKHLYPQTPSMIRIDCGEYQQKHDAHKLIGAPPSYVGHDDGGQLTNKIINNPNSVILLDEIEKAHPDVWDIFLRVLEDGILTDSKGREVDFSNSIIILTTNLGNDAVSNDILGKKPGFGGSLGGGMSSKVALDPAIVEKHAFEAIRKYLRTEFINRIDKIIVFNNLTEENLVAVADQSMQELDQLLAKKGFVLRYDETVTNKIAKDASDSISNARGILKYRKDNIDDLLTDCILAEKVTRGTIFFVLLNENNKFYIEVKKPTRAKRSA